MERNYDWWNITTEACIRSIHDSESFRRTSRTSLQKLNKFLRIFGCSLTNHRTKRFCSCFDFFADGKTLHFPFWIWSSAGFAPPMMSQSASHLKSRIASINPEVDSQCRDRWRHRGGLQGNEFIMFFKENNRLCYGLQLNAIHSVHLNSVQIMWRTLGIIRRSGQQRMCVNRLRHTEWDKFLVCCQTINETR